MGELGIVEWSADPELSLRTAPAIGQRQYGNHRGKIQGIRAHEGDRKNFSLFTSGPVSHKHSYSGSSIALCWIRSMRDRQRRVVAAVCKDNSVGNVQCRVLPKTSGVSCAVPSGRRSARGRGSNKKRPRSRGPFPSRSETFLRRRGLGRAKVGVQMSILQFKINN